MCTSQRAIITLLCSLVSVIALACEWDYDTEQMEKRSLPSLPLLISGQFLRHSPEFYRWRIEDRQGRLKREPRNLALYNDIAVAYDKTGSQDKAIETILAKDDLQPGLYETEANLGSFLIHAGRLREGLEHLEKALEINPDAHFGRERYQMLLVEYMLSRQIDGKTVLPLAELELKDTGEEATSSITVKRSFTDFLKHALLDEKQPKRWEMQHRREALNGIQGMLKFGSHDSPVLLEALADVLLDLPDTYEHEIAARALLKAAIEAKDPAAKRTYRLLARRALTHPKTGAPATDQEFVALEQEFQKELAQAKTWYGELRENEMSWIREGKNADSEFDRLYENPDSAPASTAWQNPSPLARLDVRLGLAVSLAALAACAHYIRRRTKKPSPPSPYV